MKISDNKLENKFFLLYNEFMMELLAPAGDKQKLIMAIEYGADAVYLASTRFGLRTFAGNFDQDELKWAVEYAHKNGVKVYVTVNYNSTDVGGEAFSYYEELILIPNEWEEKIQ